MAYNVDSSIKLLITALALNPDNTKLAVYAEPIDNQLGGLYGWVWTVYSSDGRIQSGVQKITHDSSINNSYYYVSSAGMLYNKFDDVIAALHLVGSGKKAGYEARHRIMNYAADTGQMNYIKEQII